MTSGPPRPRLRAQSLRLAYEGRTVVPELDLSLPDGRITVVVGANACGKSTLLRALARLMRPAGGAVLLDGQAIHTLPTRQVACQVGILPQSPLAPEGISVLDLVSRGRAPHQNWWRQWSAADREAVHAALAAAGVADLAHRPVDELSGGQRQRVWIAMAVAQQTPVLLLDEPTTFLDLAHQIDVLDMVGELNRRDGRTVVMVLHDLNQAARYADHLVVLRDGRIVAEGEPGQILTAELVTEAFGLACQVVPDPVTGTPMVIPLSRHRSAHLTDI